MDYLTQFRNDQYSSLISACQSGEKTVKDIIKLGAGMMRKAKLHPHFFRNHSIYETAQYLVFFSLQLPYQYHCSEHWERKVTAAEASKITALFERRISERVPVEYLTQEAWYLGNKFYVNEHVLVPRSLMNTRFEDFLKEIHWENYRVLDLCAGSGCIGITLALLNPNIQVDLADISTEALKVADINIKAYHLENRLRCIQGDLFDNIQDKYDLIITNPPYVADYEYRAQPNEVKSEPRIALLAGKEGLEILNKIIKQAKHYLNPEGTLIAEVGYAAAKCIKKKYTNIAFKWYKCRHPSGRESLLDLMIKWTGYLDSIFLCHAKDLSNFN